MPTPNLIGHHVYMDAPDLEGINAPRLEEHIRHLKIAKPLWENVTAASRFVQGMQYCERLRKELDYKINIIFRNQGNDGLADDGIWSQLTPQQYYDRRIKPIQEWLIKHNIVMMTDNESVVDDMTPYSDWMSEIMEIAGAVGVRVAFGRTSDGNPPFAQFQRGNKPLAPMEGMFRTAAKFPVGFHVYSPNAYFGQTPSLSNSRVDVFQRAFQMCKDNNIPIPVTVYGEFAITVTRFEDGKLLPDPYNGYKSLGWTEEQAADYTLQMFNAWVAPYGVAACLYAVGIWKNGSFSYGRPFYERLETYSKQPSSPTVDNVILPDFPTDFSTRAKKANMFPVGDTARVYSKATTTSAVKSMVLKGGAKVEYITPDNGDWPPYYEQNVEGFGYWLPVKGTFGTGWVFTRHVYFSANSDGGGTVVAFPDTFDTRAISAICINETNINIRETPSTTGKILGRLTPNLEFKVIEPNELLPNERVMWKQGDIEAVWVPVKTGTIKGWCWDGVLDYRVKVIPPPPPPPPPDPIPDDMLKVLIETNKAITGFVDQLGRLAVQLSATVADTKQALELMGDAIKALEDKNENR